MGQNICQQTPQDNDLSLDPLSSAFRETPPFAIPDKLNQLLNKLSNMQVNLQSNYVKKSLIQGKIINSNIISLSRQVKSNRPVGECLFYFHQDTQKLTESPSKHNKQQSQPDHTTYHQNLYKKRPIFITSYITPHYIFSSQTLIIYQDHSYYIGDIMAKKYQVPKANGQGLLVTKDFIYQGEFENGFPQGYGIYRTKSLQFTGYIKKGTPCGECIEKTSKGMFIGRIDENNKVGFLITPQNKRIQIKQSTDNHEQINI